MSTIRSMPNGKHRVDIRKNYKFIQSKTFSTKEEASEWAESIDNKIEEILKLGPKKLKKISPDKVDELGGLDLFQKLGVQVEFITFKVLADKYMEQWTGKDENFIRRVGFWLSEFHDTPVKSIKSIHIEKVLDRYSVGPVNGYGSTKKKTNNTLNRMKAAISSVLAYGVDKRYLSKNVAKKVCYKAVDNKIERYLSDKERNNLLKACSESSWDKMYLLVLLGITTGMRKSELMKLRWPDINFDKGLAGLATTKNGSPRMNPIPLFVLDEMKKFRHIDDSYVFNNEKNPEKPYSFRDQWDKAREKAGLIGFRFHDLRHTAASYLVMNGATLHETAGILGHKSMQTTQRYAHLSTDHKIKLSERVMSSVFQGE